MLVYGKNVAKEILKNPKKIRKIYLDMEHMIEILQTTHIHLKTMQKKKSLVSVLDFQETAEKDSVQTIVAETETTKIIWDSFRMSFQNI